MTTEEMKELRMNILDDLCKAKSATESAMREAQIRHDKDSYQEFFDRWLKVCELIIKCTSEEK